MLIVIHAKEGDFRFSREIFQFHNGEFISLTRCLQCYFRHKSSHRDLAWSVLLVLELFTGCVAAVSQFHVIRVKRVSGQIHHHHLFFFFKYRQTIPRLRIGIWRFICLDRFELAKQTHLKRIFVVLYVLTIFDKQIGICRVKHRVHEHFALDIEAVECS